MEAINFKPLGDRIVVKQREEEHVTSSGIIIPDSAKEKPLLGTIVGVSTDVDCEDLVVGATVVFGKYLGTTITLDKTDYLIMNTDDILGILPAA